MIENLDPLAAERDPRVRPLSKFQHAISELRGVKVVEGYAKVQHILLNEAEESHHALLVALRQFGRHKDDCEIITYEEGIKAGHTMFMGYPKCNCGFAAALQLAEEGR